LSSLSHETLVMMDRSEHKLRVWMDDAERSQRGDSTVASSGNRSAAVSLDVEGEPVAALPMRLNMDALSDLVILRAGGSAASLVTTQSINIVVTNTSDCGENGCGSLRDAINQANRAMGSVAIQFSSQAFDGTPTIQLQSPLPSFMNSITVDGRQSC